MDFLDWLTEIFRLYGYYFLFFATLLENVPFVGMFLPGEVIVLAAGFFAAQGQLDLAAVIVVACFGAMSGSGLSYFLGRQGGRQLIESIAVKFRVDPSKLDDADKYFDSHGALTVFIGRY
ncbi:MAG: DedA family protein, partial [Actinomycetia bacterium]|nr:DedA family protein [Actinomycetes bacterium]